MPQLKLPPRFLSLPHRQKEISDSSQTVSPDLFFAKWNGVRWGGGGGGGKGVALKNYQN